MNMNCRLPLPYPAARVQEKNLNYAKMLMPSYSGAKSELSAITTYCYQSLITAQENKRLSDILDCISGVEMKHFRLLGQLICLLGADPSLYIKIPRGKAQYWSSYFTDFTKDQRSFILNNIKDEEAAVMTYEEIYRKIPDQGVRAVLERIIADEEHHIKIFKELLK